MIGYEIVRGYINLPDMVARALNIEHAIARGENWIQQLRQTVKYAKDAFAGSERIDWDLVKRKISAGKPNTELDMVEDHVAMIKKYGGAPTFQYADDCCTYLEAEMPHDRVVPGSFIRKVATVPQIADELTPRFMFGCIATNAVAGDKQQKITTADVATNRTKDVQDAERVMREAKVIMEKDGVADINQIW